MYQQFLTEATLLKNLKHPGIPIIYDLEEDEEYLYIIEEYIQGESLKAVLLNQKAISREAVIHFTIQICNIIEYLHNLKPYPVLYLDLKPDHIIVCNDCIKIIDFGAAIYMEKEEVDYSFGTPSFAAPEQFDSLKLDSKADIYAIGCIIYFMLTGKNPSLSNQKITNKEFFNTSHDLKKIILKCTAINPQDRYENVTQLIQELSICRNKKNTLIIAVLGSQPRIGVSHIAIGMVSFLNKNGIKAIYEEKNEKGVLSYLKQINSKLYQKEGIYYLKEFEAVPDYIETICIDKSNYEVIVKDCGTYQGIKNDFGAADVRFLVLGTKEWELNLSKDSIAATKDVKVQYLFNLCEKRQAYKAAQYLGVERGYRIPLFSDPFEISNMSGKVFKDMLKDVIHIKRRKFFKR